MEPLQEVELLALAEDVSPRKYSILCNALGYTYAKGQAILEKHLKDVNRALAEILITWKTNQKETDQLRFILASKLREVGLGDLGDSLCKGSYHLTRRDQCDRHDPETVPLPTWSADIHKEISDSFTVSQCREKLKNVYLNELCKIPMKPWDRNDYAEFKDMHTRVTMVKKDSHGKDTRKKETLEGSVSEIFSTKVNGTLPARILISAPAGRGKTTAVAKIAHDWAHRVPGSALEHLPLLFLLKFRNTDEKMSIGEAIKSQLLSDVDDLTPEDLESFIRKNQSICHIILDGLDEYAGIADNQGLGSNIVDVMLWKTYRECRVLVTTRPHLESFFNQENLPTVYTKMWIEGFSVESSRDYIDKFFALTPNPSDGQGLKVYLDDQPLINELVITPLFCLMVCHLWEERLLGEDIRTQTELLDNVNVFMMHHCNRRLKPRREISEEKLPKIVRKLGKVALYGLLDDAKKLVFTPHDFQKVPNTLEVACELGVISKTIVSPARLPKSHKPSSTTIEFYHKIAQEHSAGKYLAAKSKKRLWPWQKTSFLERVLCKIKANIGDYENLIRFAAGTENNLCITIMEAILANSFLDESERYRILLDCSSETSDTEGGVASLVKRCVTAQSMVLKSPTVYTVVGMQNLPEQLKGQIREVKFEDSTPSTDVVSGLWSCMRTFSALRNLTISDCSLGFPPTSPELPSVMELKIERVTSQSYDGLLSSIPNVKEIDIAVGSAEEENISQIQTSLRRHLRGQELTLIRLDEPHSLPSEESVSGMSREIRGLGLLTSDSAFHEGTLFGVICGPKETVIDLVQSSTRLMSSSLYTEQLCGSLNSDRHARNMFSLTIRDCKLTAEITSSMWSCLRSFPSLDSLIISDSSLSFPPSPPELTSVTKLKAARVTSQCYEGLLSSLPGLEVIDITIDDAERDISNITACLRRTGGQQLRHIALQTLTPLQPEKNRVSRETMRTLGTLIKDQTNNLQMLAVSGVNSGDEEDLVALIECCRHAKSLDYLLLICCGSKRGGRLESYAKDLLISKKRPRVLISHETGQVDIEKYQLSTEMTIWLWSSLSFLFLCSLTISDSSLSFPPSPPELEYVMQLEAKGVTSQSYEGLLSSLPGLHEINISIDDAERDISQITAGLRRTRGQQLERVYLHASDSSPPEKRTLSRETMRELGLLIREQTKNVWKLWLAGVKCTDEEDLVYLIECCRHVEMRSVWFAMCGTKEGGRLVSHLKSLPSGGALAMSVWHDNGGGWQGWISRIP